jgi:hypothetical protein
MWRCLIVLWLALRLAVLCTACSERREFFYASLADAVAAGETTRGWLPDWLPRSAHAIAMTYAAEAPRAWGSFEFSPNDVGSIPFLESFVRRHWSLVWVLGPPSAMLYRLDYLPTYFVGSAVVASCMVGIVRGFRRESSGLLVWAVLGLCAWIAFGLVSYAPTM